MAHQELGGAAVGRLAAGQREDARTSVLVPVRLELLGAPASADVDRLRPLPPLPPAAQRCAFMVVLSYNRFVRWAAQGAWGRAFNALAEAGRQPADLLLE